MVDVGGYDTTEADARFVVTHTSGSEIVSDEYPDLADAQARAAEVFRDGDWPVTIDSTTDGRRWAYTDTGTLEAAPGLDS